MPPRSGKSVVEDLKDYLRYRIETGADEEAIDPAILDSLGTGRDVAAPRAAAPASDPEPAVAEAPEAAAPEAAAPEAEPVTLSSLTEQIAACTACGLCETRTKTVPGQGNPQPEIMFIGEAPGADEDQQGLAFVGRAGQLLENMLIKLGLSREEVFIGNILKCRPPGNRNPEPGEMDACIGYLEAQIAILQPKVIVALGRISAQRLLETETGIGRLRGNWMQYQGIDLMPTYHPSYLLRDENKQKRWETWSDMQKVMEKLGRDVPG